MSNLAINWTQGLERLSIGIKVSVWEFVIVKRHCSYIENAKALKNKTAFTVGR